MTTTREPRREVQRQHWSFSPTGSTADLEHYRVDLQEVTSIDLKLDPVRDDTGVFTSLQALQIG